jgi:hypothetical protein
VKHHGLPPAGGAGGRPGRQAGLILREGNAPLGVGAQPNYIGDDLDVIDGQLIERYPS